MSCACGVQCERPCNAEPGSICEDCQCRKLHEGPCQPDLDAAVRAIVDLLPIVRNGDGIFDARATQAIAFATGVATANTDWESALGPLLEHNGCDCNEETDAPGFEVCFAHRVQNVINERRGKSGT